MLDHPLTIAVLVGAPGWILAVLLYALGRRDTGKDRAADKTAGVLAAEIHASVARESEERRSAELLLEQTNALMGQMQSWIELQQEEISRLRTELAWAKSQIEELLKEMHYAN